MSSQLKTKDKPKTRTMTNDLAPISLFELSEEGKILDVNLKGVQILGSNRSDVLGEFFQNFVSNKRQSSFNSFIQRAFENKNIELKESVILGDGNRSIYSQMTALVQDQVCHLAISDLTKYKNIELKYEEAIRQLQNQSTEKDMLISVIAHDLRNPFNSIIGFGELMALELSKNNYPKVERYASIIHESSVKAMDLLANLVKWSQSQSGAMSFNPQNILLASVVDETCDLFDLIVTQKEISIKKSIPLGLEIFADSNMLATILTNLISNAVKFVKTGGEIIVTVVATDESLTLSVKDDGVGMAKEDLDKLFKLDTPFSSLGSTHEKGTGLGLALCKDLVSRHGGKIWAEARKNQGSAFNVAFPKFA